MLNWGVLDVPNVSFVDEDSSVRYLLEYDYVDLGLPSGLKWAKCNVGATSPEQAGLYFAWGETTGYTADDVTSGVRLFIQNVYDTGPAASIKNDLTLEQDAAHVNLGGNWRMPTKDEYQELLDNCDVVWTADYNGTGVAGKVFTSKVNGNSVFFPATGECYNSSVDYVGERGYYWSANFGMTIYDAYKLFFNSRNHNMYSEPRSYGHSVRAVCE